MIRRKTLTWLRWIDQADGDPRALHEDVEENVPRLVEVTSLINARETRGQGDEPADRKGSPIRRPAGSVAP